MKKQSGARFIKKQREALRDKEEVCLYHIKRESELVGLSNRAVKRRK